MHFGYPYVKAMDMSMEKKVSCIMVILFNLAFFIFVSCYCYFQILRQRGLFGHNSVGVINDVETTPATNGVILIKKNFFITDATDK